MTLPLRPNTEIVAAAWLGTIPGLSPDMVAMVLPDPSKWSSDGFVLVGPVVGGTMLDIPAVSPVVQVDCFATNPGSNKPPWGRVDLLVEHIRAHTKQRDQAVRAVEITASGVTYPSARVAGARLLTEPRRGYGDPADWAHKTFDLALLWTETEAIYS
jgi:hypothetical protein